MPSKKPSSSIKAVGFLSRREHSQAELIAKLKRAGYATEEIKATLGWLVQRGLQSNDRFIETLSRNRVSKGYGNRAIYAELLSHGLSWPVSEESNSFELESEQTRIRSFLQRKYVDLFKQCVNDQNQVDQEMLFSLKIKVFRALSRRGFDQNNIQCAWKAFIDEFDS